MSTNAYSSTVAISKKILPADELLFFLLSPLLVGSITARTIGTILEWSNRRQLKQNLSAAMEHR